MPKVSRRLLAAISLVGLLGALVAATAGLTYSGFCLSEMRYFSDEEKIRSVVSRLLGPKVFRTDAYGWIDANSNIAYESVDEFLRLNPDCCRIGVGYGEHLLYYVDPPTLFNRLAGLSDVVLARYALRTLGKDGVVSSKTVYSQLGVDVCGRAFIQGR